MNEQTLKKRKETLRKNLKQIAAIDSTETHISIDYEMKKLRIYTSKAAVMNRLERLGYKHTVQDTVDGEIYSRSYEFDTKDIGSFLRTGIFKFD